ncbi:MAG: hypothetical protein OXU34_06390, partial [Gammaproteobacteria bacterium]|nr:hypothetical protein [Gammaproteobacteria bacterium]
MFAAGAAHGQGTPTFGIVAPDSPAQEGAAPQFSIIYTSSDQSPLPAAAVLTATVTNDVPPGHTNFSGLTGTGRACNSDWLGGTDDDSGCSDPGQTLAAVSCTVPANTPHGGGITCRLPMVADDTLAERAENYRVTLSGGPAGALFNPTSAQHTIATDELITISPVSATSVVEGSMAQGSTAVVRINFNATSGTTVPGEFRVAFEHNGEIVETPVISNWPAGGFNPAVGFTFDWAVHTTGDNVANQRDRTVEYTLRGSRTFNFGYAIAEPPPVVTITVIDNNALFWTARAWLMVDPAGTITTMHTVSDVNENAPPIASPATADPAAAARDDVMYFAFFNYARLMPRSTSDTVVTYCLGGTAVGGTAEQAAASPSEYDYIWPGNYDPDSETRGEVNFCTRGRGTFTIAAGAGDVYRLGVTLNDDNLNEGGDTITAAIVAVDEPGYSSLPDGSLAIGTAIRTIRDNDAIAAAIDPAGPDFRPGVGHQVEEGRIARFLITLDHVSAATATVPYEVDEDTSAVESADYGAFFAVEDGVTNVNPPGVKKAGHLVIPAGRTSATLAVPIELDDDTDVNEWMRIQLPVTPTAGTAWAAAGTIGPDTRPFTTTRTRNQADVYIAPLMSSRTLAVLRRVDAAGATTTGAVIETDDDAAAWFIAGFAGAADIPFTTDARVRWRVEGGGAAETAAADNDFAAVAGEFTMPAGATETRFAIPVAGDNRNEPTEVFDIFLEAADPVAGGGTLPSGAATYMIADDDRVIITLSGGRRFPEGERPDVIVNFGAELTRGLLTVRVDIVRAPRETLELYPVMNDYDLPQIEHGDGNTGLYGLPATPPNLSRAQIGGDIFMLPPVPGATSGAIPLYYFDEGSVDNLNEADETFWVVIPESRDRDSIYLSGAWGDIEVAAASQQYIIEDGDPITVSVAAAADTVAEGRSVRFNVTLEGAAKGSSADLDVLYTLSGPGGGVIPVDYGVGRLRFNGAKDSSRDGDTAGVITVGIPPVDALGAASEDGVITLEITGVEGIYSEPTLVANRELHVAQLVESDDYAIGEVTVSSTRNRASVAVDWVDGEHVFEATLAPPGRIAEGADANTMANWTITRTAGPDLGAGHLRLMWSVVPGAGANAAEAADFAATGGVLTFSGSTQSPAAQQLFNVQVVPDNLNEGDESFRVVFAAATATNIASLPPPQQIVIADNADDTIEVVIIRSTLTAVAITEDAPAPAIFRVDLSGGQRTSRVFMPFTISGDGITASDFDILSLTSSAGDAFDGELVFGGSAFEHTHVRLLDDDLNEAAETLTLTGAPPGADGLRTAGAIRYAATADADNAEVEILDNDPILVSLSASPDVTPETSLYNLWEGRVARFFITMDRASAAPATIAWAFLAGHGLRYRGPAEGTVTIPAGQTSATVGVRVLEGGTDDDLVFHLTNSPAPSAAGAISTDADNERLHVFFLPLMSTRTLTVLRRVDAAGATTTGAVVETDDDLALHYIAGFAGADDAPFAEDTRIRWLVGHGNRPAIVAVTDDDDFAAVSGEFTMPAGATETRFAITLTGDNRNESTETFNLSLSVDDAVLAAATTDDRTALGDVLVTAIRDDDPVVITLGGGRSFAEGTTPSLTVDFGAELTRPFLSHVNIYRHRDLAQGSALPDPGNHVVDRDGTELFTGSRWLPQGSYPWTWIARSQPTAMGFTAPAGTTAASITLDLFIDDGLNEADEMFWVTLNLDDNGELLIVSPQDTFEPFLADGAYGRAVFAVSSQAYTIVDNDPATLVVAADAAAVTEGRSVRFNVRLEGPSGGSDGDLDVLYTLDGLDGVAPVDLGGGRLRINRTQSAGAITVFIPPTGAFGASSDAQTLTLAINGVERRPTESLFQRDVHPDTGIVSISESVDRAAGEFNVSSTRSRASVTVNWADGEHVFELTSAPAVVSEAGGAAAAAAETWRVTRTAGRNLDGDGLQISWSAFPAGVGAGAADAADFTQSGAGDLTFRGAPGSATAQSFRVGINADGVSETTETFIVAFAVAAGNLAAVDAAGGLASLPAPHRVAIADNPADAVTVDIARDSATPASVAEGGEAAFRITLSGGARSADVMVPFMFSGDGITDSDFDIISPDSIVASTADGVLVFYTGNLRGRNEEEIRVRLPADNLNEAAETLTLSGAPPGAAGLRTAIGAIRYTTDTAVVSIADADRIQVSIAVAGADADPAAPGHQVQEGRTAEFTVTMDRTSVAAATIPYIIGGEVEPEDYGVSTMGAVVVPAGRTTAALTIPIRRDADTDTTETMTVALAESGYSAAGDIGPAAGSTATSVQITPLPAARTLRLVRADAAGVAVTTPTVAESDAGVAVYYRVGFEAGGLAFSTDTEVLWAVGHGNPSSPTVAATDDDDFAVVTGAVVMAAGTTDPAAFTLTIEGDNRNEPAEHFIVSVTVADPDADDITGLGDGVALAVEDDDRVVIRLSGGGSFTEGSIPAPLLHLDFGAELTRPFYADIALRRDDNPATRDIEIPDVRVGDDWQSAGSSGSLVVGARLGRPQTFQIPAGQSTGSVRLTALLPDTEGAGPDDGLNEADEVFQVVENRGENRGFSVPGLTAHGPVAVAGTTPTWTIVDDDDITVVVRASSDAVVEGRSVRFDIALEGAAGGSDANMDLFYTLTGLDDAPVTPSDSGGGRLRINRLQTTAAVIVGIPFTPQLGMMDDDRVLSLVVTGVQAAPTSAVPAVTADPAIGDVMVRAPHSEASVTVEWLDAAHVFTLSGAAAIAERAAFAIGETYMLTHSGPDFVAPLEIVWRIDAGGAGVADFTGATSGTLAFSGAGGGAQTFGIFVATDDLNETTETFSIVFDTDADAATSAGGVTLPAAHEVVITDSADDAIEVTVSRDTGTPASVAENSTAIFTVALSGGVRTADVVVPFMFSGAGITDADFDITTPSGAGAFGGELVFAAEGALAGDSTGVAVQLLDDDLNEAAKTLTLGGGAIAYAGGGAIAYADGGDAASVVITDNDPIEVSIAVAGVDYDAVTAGHQVPESRTAEFTVSMNRVSAATATIPYIIGGAVEPADYDGTTEGTVTIAAGSTAATLAIPILRDADTDTTETLTVTLAESGYSAAGVIGRTADAAGRGAEVEIVPLMVARTLQLTRVDGDGNEDTNPVAENTAVAGVGVRYRVGFTDAGATPFADDTAIAWRVVHGHPSSATVAATAAADFAAVSGSVVMAAAATQTAFTVTVAGDDLNEATEYFMVALAVDDIGTLPGSGTLAAITDDDAIEAAIAVAGADRDADAAGHQVREGGTAEFTVSMDRASAATATIPYTVGGDVEPEDYDGAAAGTVMIAAGRTTAALVIPILRDDDTDAAEIMTVALAESGYAAAGVIGRTAAGSTATSVQIVPAVALRTLQLTRVDGDDNEDTGAIAENTTSTAAAGVGVRYR